MTSSGLRTLRLEPAVLGEDKDSSWNAIPKQKGASVQNLLTGRPGKLVQRGPISEFSAAHSSYYAGTHRPPGMMQGQGLTVFGSKIVDVMLAGQILEPQQARYKGGGSSLELTKAKTGANTMWWASPNNMAPLTPTDRTRIPGARQTQFGQYVYAYAYDSLNDAAATDGIVTGGPTMTQFERHRRLLRWNTSTTAEPTSYVKMPYSGMDVRIWYNRLLCLGASDPDPAVSNVIARNTMWFTRALTSTERSAGINAADVAVTIWTDEVSGARNNFDLIGNDADAGYAMAAVGRNLAIFKRHEIILLTGFGPDTWQQRHINQNVGILDNRSIVEIAGGVFFLSQQGYMFFDGANLRHVSRGLGRTLGYAADRRVGDTVTYGASSTGNGGFAIASLVGPRREHILLTIGAVPHANGSSPTPLTDFCGLYHIPSDTWSTVTSGLWPSGGPLLQGTDELQGDIAWDRFGRFNIRSIPEPENVDGTQRGFDDDSAAGPTNTDTNIATNWFSRVVELATPFNDAALHRIIIDYEWAVHSGFDNEFTGPTVNVTDGAGTLLSSFTLPSSADNGDVTQRKRYVKDLLAETSDIQVQIVYTGTVRAMQQCSIQDVWIEYTPAQETRV